MTQPNQTSADQRREPRVEILENLNVKDIGAGTVLGQLANISSEGLMLVSPRPLSIGRSYRLLIPLAANSGDDLRIQVTAESLWCEDANSSGMYWTGFHITTISAADQAILNKLVSG